MSSRYYPNSEGTLTPKVSTWKPRLNIKNSNNIGTDSNGDLINKSSINNFDATIGVGGDYITLGDIVTAIGIGKRRFKAVGNIASTGGSDITLTTGQSVYIDLGIYTLDMGSFNWTINSGAFIEITGNYNNTSPYTNRGKLVFAYSSAKVLLNTTLNNLIVSNIYFENNSITSNCAIALNGIFQNIYTKIPNYENGGFGNYIARFGGSLTYSVINGGGLSCNIPIYSSSIAILDNLTFTGSFSYAISSDNGYISNIYLDCDKFLPYNFKRIENVKKISGIIQYQSGNDCQIVNSDVDICTPKSTSSYITFIDCNFKSAVSLATYTYYTRGKFINCIFDSTFKNRGYYGGGFLFNFENCMFKDNFTIEGPEQSIVTASNCEFLANVLLTGTINSIFDNCRITGTVITSATSTNLTLSNSLLASTFAHVGNNLILYNNRIVGATSINGDKNKITNNTITGATTLSAGSEYNIITGNHFDGGFTNSSGVTNNEINNNIG